MSVSASQRGERLALERGSVAVCVPVIDELGPSYRCLRNVVANTPAEVPLVVVEDARADPAIERFLTELNRELFYVRLPDSPGPIALVNAALEACGGADVALLSSHALVFESWLERMRDASRSDTTIATVSALGNNAGLFSIADPHEPIAQNMSLERVASDVAAGSPQARPRAPTADGHCVWIARSAIELVGPLDVAFESLRAALIDFAQRCLVRGLVNVAADDVFVPSVMPGLSAKGSTLDVGADRGLLERRYPYLRPSLDERAWPSLSRSLATARRAIRTLSVTIDARIVRGSFSGAHAETLELIEALAGTQGVRVRTLIDPAIGADALATLDRLPGVERLSAVSIDAQIDRSDVVHRPYQVTSVEDLELLARLGERLVITHLDLIAYHNPGYFGSFEGWHQHRRVTRQALAMADRVIFLSKHAAEDAIREGLVERDRIRVMSLSVNRRPASPTQRRPAEAPQNPFLLCIGNDFRHKNRLFAIKLLAELRERGWDGQLLLVGADVGHGSSRDDEAAYLATRTELASLVRELPSVDEAEKAWLYENAAAVVFPTVYEGFGLIPFEAARAGTPCLFAPQASLAEVLPAEAALLVPWDARASVERVLPVLRDGEERRRQVELVAKADAEVRDRDSIGADLLEIYEKTVGLPLREAAALATEARLTEAELARWVALKESMGLVVGPDAPLPPDAQRGLVAIAQRRRLRRPFYFLLGRLYRIGLKARRR